MPTYEYVCTSCAHAWEAEQSIKESALTDCPSCTKATAQRQISRGAGFILKGGGWYADLYSSPSNKGGSSSSSTTSSSDSSASSSSGSGSSSGSSSGGGSTPAATS